MANGTKVISSALRLSTALTRKGKETLYGPKRGSTPPGIRNRAKGA